MKTLMLLMVRAVAFLLAMLTFSIVFTYPVQITANHLFSPAALFAVFGVPYLTVSKAFGLSFLTAVLFRSMK